MAPSARASRGFSSAPLARNRTHPAIDSLAPGVFRTNVGFAQTSTGTYQLNAELYSAVGTLLAQKTYSMAAAWKQVNDIFSNMGIGGTEVQGGWIRVRLVSGSPPSGRPTRPSSTTRLATRRTFCR